MRQARYEQAKLILNAAIKSDPDQDYAHALLAQCCWATSAPEAEELARSAVRLNPLSAFNQFVLSTVLRESRLQESWEAAQAAHLLDPECADYAAHLARIELQHGNAEDALTHAELGLTFDHWHTGCVILRGRSLVRLGRAGLRLEDALAAVDDKPHEPLAHACLGWTFLELGQTDQAICSFRDALRLNPGEAWAREGILRSMQGSNPVFLRALGGMLWLQSLPPGRFARVILALNAPLLLLIIWQPNAMNVHPSLETWNWLFLFVLVGCNCVLTSPRQSFDLLAACHRHGRLALAQRNAVMTGALAVCLLGALLGLAIALAFKSDTLALASFIALTTTIPLSLAADCAPGWPRLIMIALTIATTLAGISFAWGPALAWHFGLSSVSSTRTFVKEASFAFLMLMVASRLIGRQFSRENSRGLGVYD